MIVSISEANANVDLRLVDIQIKKEQTIMNYQNFNDVNDYGLAGVRAASHSSLRMP